MENLTVLTAASVMDLKSILQRFLSLTADPVVIARWPTEPEDDRSRGVVVFVNDAVETTFGYSKEEVLGQPLRLLQAPTVGGAAWYDLASQRSSDALVAEVECRRADGSSFWASLSSTFVDADTPAAIYSISTIRDISAIKTRERGTVHYNEHLDSESGVLPDQDVALGQKGRPIPSSLSSRKTAAKNKDVLQSWERLPNIVNDRATPNPERGKSAYCEATAQTLLSDGENTWFENAQTQFNRGPCTSASHHETTLQSAIISSLIEERNIAEEKQARLTAILLALPDPIGVFDRGGNIVTFNTAYRKCMLNGGDRAGPEMRVHEIYSSAINDGLVFTSSGDTSAFFQTKEGESPRVETIVVDIELPGDIHHRVRRAMTAKGDMIVVHTDVTELTRNQRAAEAGRRRLAATVDAFPGPLGIFDADGNLLQINHSFEETFAGSTGDVPIGMHIGDMLRLFAAKGVYPDAIGREEEWVQQRLQTLWSKTGVVDLSLSNDRHMQAHVAITEDGDMIRAHFDTTEQVRQRREVEESRTRLAEALEAFPGPFSMFDKDLHLIRYNEDYRALFEDAAKDLQTGMHLEDVLRLAAFQGIYLDAIGREEAWIAQAMESISADDGIFDLPMANDRHLRAFVSFTESGDMIRAHTDITELVRQSRAAEAAERRLRDAIEAYPDPFAIYDSEMCLVTFNTSFASSMAVEPDTVQPGVRFQDLMRSALEEGKVIAGDESFPDFVERLAGEAKDGLGSEKMQFADGQHYRVYRQWSERGDLIVLRANVTELVKQRRQMEETAKRLESLNETITHQALHDELTGLGNRRFLTEKYQELIQRRLQEDGEISVLNIDLDRFKQINDTMGHAAGDHVLKTVANRLKALTGPDEWPARNGGDEFVILIWEKASSERPAELANALVRALPKNVTFEGRDCRFGVSVGVASTPLAQPEELFTDSDTALYRVKKSGRGRVGIFDFKDQEEVTRKQRTADEILDALERSEMEPFYQPQVDAATGRVVGLEALARWRHPLRGILPPIEFIGIADELSVVQKIDRMIFEKAISECTGMFEGWNNVPDISFNISAGRIRNDDLGGIPERVNAYPGGVTFELLETIFLEEEDMEFLMKLDQLREMGISIEVDDFGSGRASVVALQRIGPDRLKIDRRLVSPIAESPSARRLVRSIIEIGNALEIGIVAEGVETKRHADILCDLGVDRLQGYYYAPPLSGEALRDFLELHEVGPSRQIGLRADRQ